MNFILSEADMKYMLRVSDQRERNHIRFWSSSTEGRMGNPRGGKREMDGCWGSLTECVGQGFPNSNISCGRETATSDVIMLNFQSPGEGVLSLLPKWS